MFDGGGFYGGVHCFVDCWCRDDDDARGVGGIVWGGAGCVCDSDPVD